LQSARHRRLASETTESQPDGAQGRSLFSHECARGSIAALGVVLGVVDGVVLGVVDGVVLGVVLGVVDGVVLGVLPEHVIPFTANAAGAAFVPEYVKFPAGVTEPPVATEPFHEVFVTVTFLPDCAQVPFQPLCSVWLPA
jgi:F0F1-type ATP synthase assembly protein I